MSEVKQEGDFKVKKPTVKKLNKPNEVVKVEIKGTDIESPKEQDQTIKVDLTKKQEDAVQNTGSESSVLEPVESSKEAGQKTEMELQEVGEGNEKPTTDVHEETPIIQEITEEEVQVQAENLQDQVTEAVQQSAQENINLPENIQKVVDFMNETGGTLEDYVRLNADYSNVDNNMLLREYYRRSRPHLDAEDINLLMEDFSYDEELDDEKEIRKAKLAFKEEVAKARDFLDGLKSKYYDEIKLRPGVTQEQQKAMDFFNRYNADQDALKQRHDRFKTSTNKLFNEDFKGFDFNLGEKKFRYGVKNPSQIADAQSDIGNFIQKFLDKNGEVSDHAGYHKALYAARNPDVLAQHFYEQGKADAIKDQIAKSRNLSTEPRKTATGDVFVNGLKVRAISGADSAKLKVKTKRFN